MSSTGSVTSSCTSSPRTLGVSALLENAGSAAQMEDWDSAGEQLEKIYADWDSSQTFFHTIMEQRRAKSSSTAAASSGGRTLQNIFNTDALGFRQRPLRSPPAPG